MKADRREAGSVMGPLFVEVAPGVRLFCAAVGRGDQTAIEEAASTLLAFLGTPERNPHRRRR